MIEITPKENCCGCTACFNVCPQKCISMVENSEGFYYPKIDTSKCIQCKKCQKVCPENAPSTTTKTMPYWAMSQNPEQQKSSSSGGMFSVIAEHFLANNGVVCGAEYDENQNVNHIIIEDKSQLDALKKSKYIQSNLNQCFSKIQDYLTSDRPVFFTGTPCQTAGLKSYLNKDYDKLFCADIVCHGVPSKKVFDKYINDTFENKKLSSVNFRDKSTGWKDYRLKFNFTNGESAFMKREECLYFMGFVNNLFLRSSCYNCKFKIDNSKSDITLGDYWGVDKLNSKIDNDCGTSLVLAHTKKGEEILNILKDKISSDKINNTDYLKYNPSILKSADYNNKRKEFFDNFQNFSFPVLWDYIHTDSALKKMKIKLMHRSKK